MLSRVTELFPVSPMSHSDHNLLHSFLDLIRHGKHHNHNQNNQPKQEPVASSPHHPPTPPPPPPVSPGTREAAEMIVEQERETRSKMPSYAGLENFQLVDKMGESVAIIFCRHRPSDFSFSAARSPMYTRPSRSRLEIRLQVCNLFSYLAPSPRSPHPQSKSSASSSSMLPK